MKWSVALFLGICALYAPTKAHGCIPTPPDAKSADVVFAGRVTGERWPDLEAQYAPRVAAGPTAAELGYPVLLFRVVQTERLKGAGPSVVEAISPCALPLRSDERVFVTHADGSYWVYPAGLPGEEQAIRSSLDKEH